MAIQLFALITRYTLIVQVSGYGTELNSGVREQGQSRCLEHCLEGWVKSASDQSTATEQDHSIGLLYPLFIIY